MGRDVLDDVIGWQDGCVTAIDQTALPHRLSVLRLATVDELVDAIVRLAVRGAPLLGVAGALGVALAARQAAREGWDAGRLDAEVKRIADARPTAVNLRREALAVAALLPEGADAVEAAALAVRDTAVEVSMRLSERGAAFLTGECGPGPLKVHTHCNTGALACLGWGSALGVIRALWMRGALAHVVADETRPLLQGSRLTAWELRQLGIEHYLAADGAGPFLIAQGHADAVVVGADRVAANGDTANKIGTYSLALAARRAGIPFVVAAPESTIDEATASGADIPLELRADEEVTSFQGVPAAPEGTRALNYAFDVTPADLVTAIVTEDRVIRPGLKPGASRCPGGQYGEHEREVAGHGNGDHGDHRGRRVPVGRRTGRPRRFGGRGVSWRSPQHTATVNSCSARGGAACSATTRPSSPLCSPPDSPVLRDGSTASSSPCSTASATRRPTPPLSVPSAPGRSGTGP